VNTIELLLKRGQVIDLTLDIRVIIVSVDGDKCRIGIEAPDHIRILRSELIEEIGSVVSSEGKKWARDVEV
jgi:carbon storage regulator CsrA